MRPVRSRAGAALLSLLLGCEDPAAGEAPAGRAPPAAPAPGGPTPGAPAPGAPSQRMADAQLVALGEGYVDVVGPEGEVRHPARPEALTGGLPSPGRTIRLAFADDEKGVPTVTAILPHTGLPIAWGTVASVDARALVLDGPLGPARYAVNRWSDLPEGLAAGAFVSVKSYAADGGSAILNVRRYPGRVEEIGTVTEVGPDAFSLVTLGGPRTFAEPPPPVVVVGAPVKVFYRRGLDGRPVGLGVEPAPEPHLFIGKMSAHNQETGEFSMVDAWGATLGVVRFGFRGVLPGGLVPGDLADVRWRMVEGRPTIDSLTERPLSPVFFGRIDRLDADHIEMTTLQRQKKRLRRTPDTWMPAPIQVGDMADVMWSPDPGGAEPVAEAVVKE